MNDVRITQAIAPTQVPRAVASGVTVDAKNNSVSTAEASPKAKVQETKDIEASNETKESGKGKSVEKVETAVAKVNEYVQSIERNLQFFVDQDLDRTVVKVVDGNSGELIRQIPDEIFLELARRLSDDGELRLMNELT